MANEKPNYRIGERNYDRGNSILSALILRNTGKTLGDNTFGWKCDADEPECRCEDYCRHCSCVSKDREERERAEAERNQCPRVNDESANCHCDDYTPSCSSFSCLCVYD